MRLLVDANLSPASQPSYATQVTTPCTSSTSSWATATAPEIVEHAEANGLVIVTVDTNFPMLIALQRAINPSIRSAARRQRAPTRPAHSAGHRELPAVADDLRRGAIVSLGPQSPQLPLA